MKQYRLDEIRYQVAKMGDATAASVLAQELLDYIDELRADLETLRDAREQDQPDTLTTSDAAKYLNVAPRTVSKWCDAGKLPCRREPVTNNRLISADDLVAFMREHGMSIPLDLE